MAPGARGPFLPLLLALGALPAVCPSFRHALQGVRRGLLAAARGLLFGGGAALHRLAQGRAVSDASMACLNP